MLHTAFWNPFSAYVIALKPGSKSAPLIVCASTTHNNIQILSYGGKMPFSLSVCIIARDEEEIIPRLLDCVTKFADEIIVCDTGSTDRTKEIAIMYGAKVVEFEWNDNFSDARNFSFSKATKPYVFWCDADDVIPDDTINAINALKETANDDVDVYTMLYNLAFDEDGNAMFHSTRERILKRETCQPWIGRVHEVIPMQGNIVALDIAIEHRPLPNKQSDSFRNLRIYEALEASGEQMTPRELYYFARENRDHGNYAKSAWYFESFLNTRQGWYEDSIAACAALAALYHTLNQEHLVLPALVKSFEFASPRPDICCELGYYWKRQGNPTLACNWFTLAAHLPPIDSTGFVLQDYLGYIPNIEACVCLCELGKYEEALVYNKIAHQIRPTEATAHNQSYIEKMLV
jgi:glycosyltransferase involved in cell wall biosynthesis